MSQDVYKSKQEARLVRAFLRLAISPCIPYTFPPRFPPVVCMGYVEEEVSDWERQSFQCPSRSNPTNYRVFSLNHYSFFELA